MKNRLLSLAKGVRNLILALFVLSLLAVLLLKYLPAYYTPHMLTRNLQQAFSREKPHLAHCWKPLKEISPHLKQAVIASEDYLFLIHNGFDTDQAQAMLHRGARNLYTSHTTISQQTARNVFLPPGKHFLATGLESYFTLLIELVWGKERILEVYLNSVEMADAVFGAEAMAQKTYGIPARALNISQSALITACLINPTELNPQTPTVYLLRRQAKIMGMMEEMIEIRF
jgi:monofunctional biosynthetic peptidoglycan transglycosylase